MNFGFQGNSLTIAITNSVQKKKAFNFNTGDTLPERQFLPETGQNFRPSIVNGIKRIIKDIKSGSEDN